MNNHPQYDIVITPDTHDALLKTGRATTITFSCGHREIIGGNMADPTAIYKQAAGLMDYETKLGLCTACEFPERFSQRFPQQPTAMDGKTS